MKSRWVDSEAADIVARGAGAGLAPDLALRIYTTRLLGRDPKLVLHGGGNTSLKTRARDHFGRETEVLRIKASARFDSKVGQFHRAEFIVSGPNMAPSTGGPEKQ